MGGNRRSIYSRRISCFVVFLSFIKMLKRKVICIFNFFNTWSIAPRRGGRADGLRAKSAPENQGATAARPLLRFWRHKAHRATPRRPRNRKQSRIYLHYFCFQRTGGSRLFSWYFIEYQKIRIGRYRVRISSLFFIQKLNSCGFL